MGTHPIFESDFDCLTDVVDYMTVSDEEYDEIQRAKTVNKYETGDPGSDEDEHLESIENRETDQFGFYRNPRFLKFETQKLKSKSRQTKRREKKWEKMAKDFPKAMNKKLKSRTYKGIPNRWRSAFWFYILDPVAMKTIYERKGLNYYGLYDIGKMDQAVVRQVHLDVARTWRTHKDFRNRYRKYQVSIFKILLAYSAFDSEVGYCQGMSAIAALFMIIFNDEQAAFWALCSFMIKTPWTQKGMFLPGFPKLNHFTAMWEKILEATLPKIHRHFEEEGVIPQIYLTKWFLQNFLDRLPFHLCIRLWDLFLLEGDTVTIATCLTLFKMKQQNLLRMDFDSIAQFLQQDICNVNCTDDQLFLYIQKDLGQVRGSGIIRPMSNMSTWHSPKLKPRTSRQSNSSTKPVPVPRSKSRKNSVTPSKAPIPSDRKSNSGNYKSGKFLRLLSVNSFV